MCSLTGIVGLGGQRSRRSGRQSLPPIRSVEDAAPGVAALSAHGLAREQHLLTIRTPRTTSSEIAARRPANEHSRRSRRPSRPTPPTWASSTTRLQFRADKKRGQRHNSPRFIDAAPTPSALVMARSAYAARTPLHLYLTVQGPKVPGARAGN